MAIYKADSLDRASARMELIIRTPGFGGMVISGALIPESTEYLHCHKRVLGSWF